MWLFLFTELLLFGTLFILYAVYLSMYKRAFTLGSGELDLLYGAINTAILLTSSLSVALAIAAMERARKGAAVTLLVVTVLFAGAFLVIKYLEWSYKIEHQIYPGSEHVAEMGMGFSIFYALYFTMTGFHALHVMIGMVVLLVAAGMIQSGSISAKRLSFLENAGLYWHLVDVVWIFLFPLFYLIG